MGVCVGILHILAFLTFFGGCAAFWTGADYHLQNYDDHYPYANDHHYYDDNYQLYPQKYSPNEELGQFPEEPSHEPIPADNYFYSQTRPNHDRHQLYDYKQDYDEYDLMNYDELLDLMNQNNLFKNYFESNPSLSVWSNKDFEGNDASLEESDIGNADDESITSDVNCSHALSILANGVDLGVPIFPGELISYIIDENTHSDSTFPDYHWPSLMANQGSPNGKTNKISGNRESNEDSMTILHRKKRSPWRSGRTRSSSRSGSSRSRWGSSSSRSRSSSSSSSSRWGNSGNSRSSSNTRWSSSSPSSSTSGSSSGSSNTGSIGSTSSQGNSGSSNTPSVGWNVGGTSSGTNTGSGSNVGWNVGGTSSGTNTASNTGSNVGWNVGGSGTRQPSTGTNVGWNTGGPGNNQPSAGTNVGWNVGGSQSGSRPNPSTTGNTGTNVGSTSGTRPGSPYPTTGGTITPANTRPGIGTYPSGTGTQPGRYPTAGYPSAGTYPGGTGIQPGRYPTGGYPSGSGVQPGRYPTGGYPSGSGVQPGRYPTAGYPSGGAYPTGGAHPFGDTNRPNFLVGPRIIGGGRRKHGGFGHSLGGLFAGSGGGFGLGYGGYGNRFGGLGGGFGSYGSGFGGYGLGRGYHGSGFGHSLGGGFLGAAAGIGTAKLGKKILGAAIKIQIAKYALKFGASAAKAYFEYKLGRELEMHIIEKFMNRYHRQRTRHHQHFRRRIGLENNSTSANHRNVQAMNYWPANVTLGEECARPCRENDQKACLFTFNVHLYQTLTRACYDCPRNASDCTRPDCITGGGTRRLVTVVNHQLPGPAIRVCHNDRVLVEVHNELPSSGVTLHWHGVTLDGEPFMDGVTGLTQCPIPSRGSFTYSFHANFPGTHFWHAQTGLLRGEGLYGPIIVTKPDDLELHRDLYDEDDPAHVFVVSDLLKRSMEGQFAEHYMSSENAATEAKLLINGRAGQRIGATSILPYARMDVVSGKRYRVRLINAASLNCPVRVVAPARHRFNVIAADGASVRPFTADSLLVHNGERWDVVLHANQAHKRYWFTVLGEQQCEGLSQHAVLSYVAQGDKIPKGNETTAENLTIGTTPTESLEVPAESPIMRDSSIHRANSHGDDCSDSDVTCLSEMRAIQYAGLPSYMMGERVNLTLFLALSTRTIYNSHYYSALHYDVGAVSESKRSATPQINQLTLTLPPAPLLLNRKPLKKGNCSFEGGVRRQHCVGVFCECIHMYHIPKGKVVELVLVNEGLNNETISEPVHLHGHRFWVLSQEVYEANMTEVNASAPIVPSFSRYQAAYLHFNNKLKRNFDHPILKDTVSVPSGGYTIVRFRANNPGFWLLESQVLLQSAAGMGLVLQVGNATDIPHAPPGFQRC